MGVAPLSGRPAVFLDRDGVLVRSFTDASGVVRPPATLADFEIIPGAREACDLLRANGYALVVVTNQPDVPRGKQSREITEEMNRRVSVALDLPDIRVCYHDDPDGCACRKPKPGMLLDAARDHGLDLAKSFIVGDSWRDVQAGHNAGCLSVLVGGSDAGREADLFATDVLDAARAIVVRSHASATEASSRGA